MTPHVSKIALHAHPSPAPAALIIDQEHVSWYHSGRLLVAGRRLRSPDDRLQLSEDGSLRLTSAGTQDDGTFTCRVYGADGTFTEVRHHVHVQTQLKEETKETGKRRVWGDGVI